MSLNNGLISPFIDGQERFGGVTRGLSSCSYDIALGFEFKRLKNFNIGSTLSPEFVAEADFETIVIPEGSYYTLGKGAFVLAHSIETIKLPNDISARVTDKSTWARLGLSVKNTSITPGFSGQVTLELSNGGSRPLVLKPTVGICQLEFNTLTEPCTNAYSGRYQGQTGTTLARSA